jgi:hypothetical protein
MLYVDKPQRRHSPAGSAQPAAGRQLQTSEPVLIDYVSFAVSETVKIRFLGEVIEFLSRQGDFGQFLAAEICVALASPPQLPAVLVMCQSLS